jgi:hypothetical protein
LAQLRLKDEIGVKTEFVHQTSCAAQLTEIRGGCVDTVLGTLLAASSLRVLRSIGGFGIRSTSSWRSRVTASMT